MTGQLDWFASCYFSFPDEVVASGKEPPTLHCLIFQLVRFTFTRLFVLPPASRTTGGASCSHDSRVPTGIASAEKQGKVKRAQQQQLTAPIIAFYSLSIYNSQNTTHCERGARLRPENNVTMLIDTLSAQITTIQPLLKCDLLLRRRYQGRTR